MTRCKVDAGRSSRSARVLAAVMLTAAVCAQAKANSPGNPFGQRDPTGPTTAVSAPAKATSPGNPFGQRDPTGPTIAVSAPARTISPGNPFGQRDPTGPTTAVSAPARTISPGNPFAPRDPTGPTTAVSAQAKTPEEIFEIVAPSIVVVEVLDAGGKLEGSGSGVVIAPGEVITNCHVAKAGKTLRVKHGENRHSARLRHADHDRDLCQLSAPGLTAPPAQRGEVKNLKTGARVVAIGAPQGLELSISEGLISALRDFDGGTRIIQTTAPISPGSSGGGLFDEAGRLIGITTFYLAEGQNLNFALPVEWIAELPGRTAAPAKGKTAAFDWFATVVGLEEREDWPALLAHSRRWTQAEPGNSAAWTILGLAYRGIGQHTQAIEAYREALRIDPKFASAWINLGVAYAGLDQHTQAIEAYSAALRIDPKHAAAWFSLGNAYRGFGQHTQAIEAYRAALRIDPKHAMAWNNLGIAYLGLDQHTQAIEATREALRIEPQSAMAWNNLGTAYLGLGHHTQAIEAYRAALRIDPQHANAWFNLGLAYAIQGNRSGTIDAYQRLRDLDPAQADQLFNVAIAPR